MNSPLSAEAALIAALVLAATIAPSGAQDATPPPRFMDVEISERTERLWKGGAQVDETHWRLRSLETRGPQETTRHVIMAERRWVRDGVEKSKAHSIAEGRRVLLVEDEEEGSKATWTNGKPAELEEHFLAGCRIDPASWTKALGGAQGTIPIPRHLPPLLEFHLDRLQGTSEGPGTWRVEVDPKRGEVRFLAEWKPVNKANGTSLDRSLRIVVKTGPAKKPLPAKPKPPPLPCAPCKGEGEVPCTKCGGAPKPCPSHDATRIVECPDCQGRGLR